MGDQRLQQLANMLAQAIEYYESVLPVDFSTEPTFSSALTEILTKMESPSARTSIGHQLVCCAELSIRVFEFLWFHSSREINNASALLPRPLIKFLEGCCFLTPLRAFAGNRISACENLMCQLDSEASYRLDERAKLCGAWADIIYLHSLHLDDAQVRRLLAPTQ